MFTDLILAFGVASTCHFHNSCDSAEGRGGCEIESRGEVIWKASGWSSIKITALKSCEILFYLSKQKQTSTFCRVIGRIRALGFKGWRCVVRIQVRGEQPSHMTWTPGRVESSLGFKTRQNRIAFTSQQSACPKVIQIHILLVIHANCLQLLWLTCFEPDHLADNLTVNLNSSEYL